MNPHFFGDSRQPLFAVHHPPRTDGRNRPAVLICPPIGHEYIRTHWAVRLLASRLARQGHHVLRFDYRGMGDSAGTLGEVTQLSMWTENVRQAARNLTDESGVSEVAIVGLRFGAALASLAVQQGLDAAKLVLWEPITSGEEYLADLRALHATMLDLWVCPMTTVCDDAHEEILGAVYPCSLLDEIQAFELESVLEQLPITPAVVLAKRPARTLPMARLSIHDELGDWSDLSMIETAWLPSVSPERVAEMLARDVACPPVRVTTPEVGSLTGATS